SAVVEHQEAAPGSGPQTAFVVDDAVGEEIGSLFERELLKIEMNASAIRRSAIEPVGRRDPQSVLRIDCQRRDPRIPEARFAAECLSCAALQIDPHEAVHLPHPEDSIAGRLYGY